MNSTPAAIPVRQTVRKLKIAQKQPYYFSPQAIAFQLNSLLKKHRMTIQKTGLLILPVNSFDKSVY